MRKTIIITTMKPGDDYVDVVTGTGVGLFRITRRDMKELSIDESRDTYR